MTQLLFSLRGRTNRKPFWLVTTAMLAAFLVLVFVTVLAADADEPVGAVAVIFILYLPLLWTGIALGAKRLHDRDKSAWWLILFYVLPGVLGGIGDFAGDAGLVLQIASFIFSVWGIVELGFLRGTPGPNRYGPDPLGGAPLPPAAPAAAAA